MSNLFLDKILKILNQVYSCKLCDEVFQSMTVGEFMDNFCNRIFVLLRNNILLILARKIFYTRSKNWTRTGWRILYFFIKEFAYTGLKKLFYAFEKPICHNLEFFYTCLKKQFIKMKKITITVRKKGKFAQWRIINNIWIYNP